MLGTIIHILLNIWVILKEDYPVHQG